MQLTGHSVPDSRQSWYRKKSDFYAIFDNISLLTCLTCCSAGSQAPALAVIHKSVRVEISRGKRVIRSLLEKEVSRKARKGAKKSDFLCAFAPLRLCVKLALWNCRIFMCTDKYHHTCVYDEISCLVIGFLKLQLPAERPSRSLQDQGSQAGAWEPAKKPSRSWRPRPNRPHTVETDSV